MSDSQETRFRSRGWTLTWFNYTDGDLTFIRAINPKPKYLIFGFEICPDTGRPHLQGYVHFAHAKTREATKTFFRCNSLHCIASRGSATDNQVYCAKEGQLLGEWGTPPLSNKEKGMKEKERYRLAFDACKEGRFEDVDPDIRFRYYRTTKQIFKDFQPDLPPLPDGPCGLWFTGPPGTGKSYQARLRYPGSYIKAQNRWWDGFDSNRHSTVILDDLDEETLGHDIKLWADEVSFNAETKGGVLLIRPTKFIVTSNYTIEELFTKYQIRDAITRRFEVEEFEEVYEKPTE